MIGFPSIKLDGFSFLEIIVSMLIFSITIVSMMEAINSGLLFQQKIESESDDLGLLNKYIVGLRSGASLFDYGFSEKEKERIIRNFNVQNPGHDFYFDGNIESINLKIQSKFRKIQSILIDDNTDKGTEDSGNVIRHKKKIHIFRQILQIDPFLFRYRVEIEKNNETKLKKERNLSFEVSVSYYLTPFFN